MIKHIKTVEEFKNETSKSTVLVDFFATWCGPCKMIAPELEKLDNQGIEGLNIVKVDVDEAPEIAAAFNIRSIPTLIVFKEGKATKTVLGYHNLNQLLNLVK
jgi:thioredoxin 1